MLLEKKSCVIITVAMLCVSGLYGARPFTTDDAGTVETAIHELEFGCDLWSENASFALGFKHGLTERMDLGVGFGYVVAPEENVGFAPAELGVKFAIIPDVFSASLAGSFGDTVYVINGIITQSFGPLELDGNFGYEATGTTDHVGTVIYALALILNAGPYAFGAESGGDKDGLRTWLIGGRYALFEGFAVDAGISGEFEKGTDMTATLGFHFEF